VGVAVGGRGLGGGAVAGSAVVLVGSRGAGVAEGMGRVSVGTSGLGLAGTLVGEGSGEGVGVTLGCWVDVGCSVLVARARTTRVLVGVGVTVVAPGAHRTTPNPTRSIPTKQKPSQRCLFLTRCHIL
jgi:hypothetical protein